MCRFNVIPVRATLVITATAFVGRMPPWPKYDVASQMCYIRLPKDSDIYEITKTFARFIERALPDSRASRFCKFVDPSIGKSVVAFLAMRRSRKPYAQQTHVFCACDIIGGSEAAMQLKLKARQGALAYEFMSVWSLAKEFTSCDSEHLELQFGSQTWANMDTDPVVPRPGNRRPTLCMYMYSLCGAE